MAEAGGHRALVGTAGLLLLSAILFLGLLGGVVMVPDPVPDLGVVTAAPFAPVSASPPEAGQLSREVATDAMAVVRARARFRMRNVGFPDQPVLGEITVAAEEGTATTLRLENRDAVELELPRSARTLRCTAAGAEDLELTLPPLDGPEVDLGDVLLWPDATLVFVVRSLPPGSNWRPSFSAWSPNCGLRLHDVENWRLEATTEAAFASGSDFAWWCHLQGPAAHCLVRGRSTALRRGERREVVVDAADLPVADYQLVGLSPALLLRTTIQIWPDAAIVPQQNAWSLQVGSNGRFSVFGEPPAAFSLELRAGGNGTLRTEPADDAIGLRPEGQIAGLQMLDGTGHPAGFSLPPAHPQEFLVVDRSALPASFVVQAEGGPTRRVHSRDLPTDRDVIDLSRVPSQALGALTVHVTGEVGGATPAQLQAVRADGSVAGAASGKSTLFFSRLDPGVYDLQWSLAGESLGICARGVPVVADQDREVWVERPALVSWVGQVAGQDEVPMGQRFHSVRFGNHAGLGSGGWLRIDNANLFRWNQAPGREAPDIVELRCAMMVVRAELASVEPAEHRVVVRPPTGLRWVSVRATADCGPEWSMLFQHPDRGEPWMIVTNREQRAVLVPPGQRLGGMLCGGGHLGDALAWLSIDGSSPEVVVRRTGGRTVEFRSRLPRERTLALVGPDGQTDNGHALAAEPLRLFVPDGTRGYLIWQDGKPRREQIELPLDGGDVTIVP